MATKLPDIPRSQMSPGLVVGCVCNSCSVLKYPFPLPFDKLRCGKQDTTETEWPWCFVKQVGPKSFRHNWLHQYSQERTALEGWGQGRETLCGRISLMDHQQQRTCWAPRHTQFRGQPGSSSHSLLLSCLVVSEHTSFWPYLHSGQSHPENAKLPHLSPLNYFPAPICFILRRFKCQILFKGAN